MNSNRVISSFLPFLISSNLYQLPNRGIRHRQYGQGRRYRNPQRSSASPNQTPTRRTTPTPSPVHPTQQSTIHVPFLRTVHVWSRLPQTSGPWISRSKRRVPVVDRLRKCRFLKRWAGWKVGTSEPRERAGGWLIRLCFGGTEWWRIGMSGGSECVGAEGSAHAVGYLINGQASFPPIMDVTGPGSNPSSDPVAPLQIPPHRLCPINLFYFPSVQNGAIRRRPTPIDPSRPLPPRLKHGRNSRPNNSVAGCRGRNALVGSGYEGEATEIVGPVDWDWVG
jgi:hypothetical protein